MIVHVFTGDRTHLVPNILRGFLKLEINQFYIVFCSKKNVMLYNELFKEYKIVDYVLVSSWGDLKKKVDNSKIKEAKIILHGVPYSWMWRFIIACKDVNWICWGAGARINYSNWKSVIFTPFKRIIYQRFNKVGVLMPQDAISLRKDYGVKDATLLSYFGTIGSFPYSIDDLTSISKREKKNIYLGNNSNSIMSYIELVNELGPKLFDVNIICMLNYSFNENEVSQNLREIGIKYFGDNFFMSTKLYSLLEYYGFMNDCDIYICKVKKQTGLGALYTCLRQGKKVFLNGVNYTMFSSLGCKVFHTDELKDIDQETLLEPLSIEEKISNFEIISSYLDKDKIIKDWIFFLRTVK